MVSMRTKKLLELRRLFPERMHKFVGDYIYYICEHGPEPGDYGLTATERHVAISGLNKYVHGYMFPGTTANLFSMIVGFVGMSFTWYVESVYRKLVEAQINGNADQVLFEETRRLSFMNVPPIRIYDVAREGDVI